jgi:hypothetical protein
MRHISIGLAAVLAIGLVFAGELRAQNEPHDSMQAKDYPGAISVQLSSDRSTYKAGEDVKLRITIRNISSTTIPLLYMRGANDVTIEVKDTQGQVLKPNTQPLGTFFQGSLTQGDFEPGSEWVETKELQVPGEWMSARVWGYAFTTPGRYTITARRDLRGAQTAPSPPVTIDIL